MLTVGSLFAGIGGFDLGFERNGFEVRWQAEQDGKAQAVLSARFPMARLYDDVRTIGAATVEPVDVICGGFPCQDVSVAGKREGLGGERTGLFWEAVRIIDELKPKWAVLENVPGLLSSHSGRDFHTVLSALADLGFRRAYRILDSQYFGVAQRRRRVFIVLRARRCRDGADAVLFEPQSGNWDSEAGDETRARVAATLRGRSHGAGVNMPGRGGEDDDTDTLIPTLSASLGHHGHSSPRGDGNDPLVAFALRADPGGTGQGHNTTYPGGVRRLTPLECERLHGFPDGWTCLCGEGHRGSSFCTCSDSPRYRQLGNAVTVNVAEWIARRILKKERENNMNDMSKAVSPLSARQRAEDVLAFREAHAPNNTRFVHRALLVDNGGRGSDQVAMTFDADDLSALTMDLRCAESDLAAERVENTHLREAFVVMERAANAHEAEVDRLRDRLTKDCIIEIAVDNPSVSDYMNHWEKRTLKAEAALAALRQQAADMERGVADALTGAMGDHDLGVVAGVGVQETPKTSAVYYQVEDDEEADEPFA